jgi:hypothetical protein
LFGKIVSLPQANTRHENRWWQQCSAPHQLSLHKSVVNTVKSLLPKCTHFFSMLLPRVHLLPAAGGSIQLESKSCC